jgi:SAM-dependent methyltransferase
VRPGDISPSIQDFAHSRVDRLIFRDATTLKLVAQTSALPRLVRTESGLSLKGMDPSQEHKTSLNIGCGTDIRLDCINLDRSPLPGVDVLHDLTHLPFPFPDARFDRIICQDVLEHLEIVPTMREFHRILSPGGVLEIRVPHFTSFNTYGDPTHLRGFSIGTFDFFCLGSARSYYFDFAFSKLEKRWISFAKGPPYAFNYAIEPLVNLSRKTQRFYESSPLRIFPAVNVHVQMRR